MNISRKVRDRVREELLVLRCQMGDRGAFEPLVLRYHDPLLYYLRRLLSDSAAAEDVLQRSGSRCCARS